MIQKRTLQTILIFLLLTSFVFFSKAFAVPDETYEKLRIFSDVLTIIEKNYVEDVDVENLIYDAIRGMLSDLDPHSSFMSPDVYRELQVETQGSFGGIGIEITMRNGVLTIVAPIEDTPAFRSGLKAGDQIVKIEGKSTKNMTLFDAVKNMRGKAGTEIRITIVRKGFKEPRDFILTRDIIQIRSIKSKKIEEDIGYIRITQFQETTADDFTKALTELESEDTPLQGLILDLRNNPGGLLDQAVKISDEFIESGLIVYTEGKTESQRMEFRATKNSHQHDYPLIVLVNAGSASGSEIVAGALQDQGRALILGTPTFGKGSVQTIIPLSDGAGVRLTTAKYYTPSGRTIQAKGISPDIVVEDRIEKPSKAEEAPRIMREKDLQEHFEEPETVEEEAEEKEEEEDKVEGEEIDLPLQRAVQLIRSWEIFKNAQNLQEL